MNRSSDTSASPTKTSRAFTAWTALLGLLAFALPLAPAQTLSENFDDGVADNWAVVSGTDPWTIPAGTDRVYVNTVTAGAVMQISTYTGAEWTTNFIIRARVKLWGTGVNNRVGLVYSYQAGAPVKYYAVMLHKASSGARLQFYENTTGAADPTGLQPEVFYVPSSGAPDNYWVDLTLSRVGNVTTVKVSSSTGSTTHTRVQSVISGPGRIGVIDRSSDSAFNNITVAAIPMPGVTEPAGGPVHGTPTRYVDFVSGSEANPDGTLALPWKYAPGMPGSTHAAVAGDVIALKRGNLWRLPSSWSISSSGTSGSPIVYTAYGSGALPKITVLEDLSTGWTAATGSFNTNVYQRTLPAGMTIERLYIDDEGMGEALVTTPAADNWVGQPRKVTAKTLPIPNPNGVVLNSVYDTGIIKHWRQNGTTLYLFSPAGNPGSLGKRIEGLKSTVTQAIRATNKSYVTIDRLEVHGGTTAVIYLEVKANSASNLRVTNCIVRSAKAKGIFVSGISSTLTGFSNGEIKWNRVDSGDGPSTRASPNGADYAGHPSSGTIDASLLYFSGEGQLGSNDGISLWNNVQGWLVAQNDVSNFWHTQLKVCVNDDTVVAAGQTYSAKDNIIEHNDAHAENINYAHGLEINAGGGGDSEAALLLGNVARFNDIHNTWVNSKHEGRNTLFYGNLITGVYGSPRYTTGSNGWAGDGVAVNGYGASGGVFAYNTLVDAGGAAFALTSNGAPITGLLVANNIFSHSGNRRQGSSGGLKYSALRDQNSPSAAGEVDNNLLYSPVVSTVYEHKPLSVMVWDNVSAMVTVNGTWNNNLGADPQFTNYGAADFTLAPASPARGAAKDITAVLPESLNWADLGAWQLP